MYTDNNPLTYILMTAMLDRASHQWEDSLANYNFQLSYWAGKTNIDADALLRVSWPGHMPDNSGTHLQVTAAAVQAVQDAALKGLTNPIEAHPGLSAGQSAGHLYDLGRLVSGPGRQIQPWVWSFLDCRMEPWDDDSPDRLIHLSSIRSYMSKMTSYYEKVSYICRRARPRESEETLFQLVLPAAYWEVTLKGCHDKVGHLDLEHMLHLMCDQFFWLHMAAQAKEHIEKCHSCLTFKAKQPKAPLENIIATHPLELVHLDYLCLEPGTGLEENVLVVTGHFTWYAQVYVTQTQTAQTTDKTLWDKFIVHYGLLKNMLSDQGRNFESQLVADLCKLMGTQKIWTSPY